MIQSGHLLHLPLLYCAVIRAWLEDQPEADNQIGWADLYPFFESAIYNVHHVYTRGEINRCFWARGLYDICGDILLGESSRRLGAWALRPERAGLGRRQKVPKCGPNWQWHEIGDGVLDREDLLRQGKQHDVVACLEVPVRPLSLPKYAHEPNPTLINHSACRSASPRFSGLGTLSNGLERRALARVHIFILHLSIILTPFARPWLVVSKWGFILMLTVTEYRASTRHVHRHFHPCTSFRK
jgi:hypothetical protein